MAHFRVIRVRKSHDVNEGWVVERTALGERAATVGPVFSTKAEAKAEADRLAAQEPRATGK